MDDHGSSFAEALTEELRSNPVRQGTHLPGNKLTNVHFNLVRKFSSTWGFDYRDILVTYCPLWYLSVVVTVFRRPFRFDYRILILRVTAFPHVHTFVDSQFSREYKYSQCHEP